MVINQFQKFDDSDLLSLLIDYTYWNESGAIPDNGLLAEMRDLYNELYGAQCLIVLELDLLRECAMRWKRDQVNYSC